MTTPGVSQNAFSAPQKQPSPNIAVSVPAGNGGVSGRPLTWCVAGTGMRSARPGSAVSFVGIVILDEPHMVVTSGLIVTAKHATVNSARLRSARETALLSAARTHGGGQ